MGFTNWRIAFENRLGPWRRWHETFVGKLVSFAALMAVLYVLFRILD